jgi:hypothetical protein
MTPEHRPVTKAELQVDLNAALESFAAGFIGSLSDLREEMRRGFDQMDKRFDTIDRRTECLETHLHAIMLNIAGVN